MNGNRKGGTEPAEAAAKPSQRSGVGGRESAQGERAAIERDQLAERRRQQSRANADEQRREKAAEHALQGTEVVERTADEGIRGADQLGDLDLGGLGENLQADGVERHRHEGPGEQGGQECQGELADA